MIVGNVIGGHPVTPRTYIIQMDNGEEVPAVLVGSETVFTATANDIRQGKVAASDTGIVTGDKVIPAYHTTQGFTIVTNGNELRIASLQDLDAYDYTKLQVIVCNFNTSISDSVAASQVVIDENVYAVQSSESVSVISKNSIDKTVDFGITNDTGSPLILRYFTYKEIE